IVSAFRDPDRPVQLWARVLPGMSHPPWSYDLAGSASPRLGANPNWWGKLRVPRAARPSTTPRDPRDSKLTPARVPAMCPTPAWVTPTDSGARNPRTHPGGGAPRNECVVWRLRYGYKPRNTFSAADVNPEQS